MLKDYIDFARWNRRDALGRAIGFGVRFPADCRAFRFYVVEDYGAPRASLLLVATRFVYFPGTFLCKVYEASHLKFPLPFSIDA